MNYIVKVTFSSTVVDESISNKLMKTLEDYAEAFILAAKDESDRTGLNLVNTGHSVSIIPEKKKKLKLVKGVN